MKALREKVKKLIQLSGYTLVAKDHFDIVPRRRSLPHQTLKVLPIVIERVFPFPKLPILIQVGACDGVTIDPINDIVKSKRFPSILVEPNPESVEKLRCNYDGFDNVKIVNNAISDTNKNCLLYRVRTGSGYEPWGAQWASFDRNHLIKHGVSEQDIETIGVRGITLATLLLENDIQRCDILQIDTEGYDDRIVKMALKLGTRPTIICFEHIHLQEEQYHIIINALIENGYRWTQIGWDTLAVLKDKI